jgi:Integrase core domain
MRDLVILFVHLIATVARRCRMFNHAIAGALTRPRHLSSDHDPLFEFHRWKANLRILDVTEIKTVPEVPLSHPFIERLVGTVRRELLDQIPFWSARDLERKLLHFRDYYNRDRVHASLGGVTPDCKAGDVNRRIVSLSKYQWQPHCVSATRGCVTRNSPQTGSTTIIRLHAPNQQGAKVRASMNKPAGSTKRSRHSHDWKEPDLEDWLWDTPVLPGRERLLPVQRQLLAPSCLGRHCEAYLGDRRRAQPRV